MIFIHIQLSQNLSEYQCQ